jgi:hypothetical protein
MVGLKNDDGKLKHCLLNGSGKHRSIIPLLNFNEQWTLLFIYYFIQSEYCLCLSMNLISLVRA